MVHLLKTQSYLVGRMDNCYALRSSLLSNEIFNKSQEFYPGQAPSGTHPHLI